MSRDRQELDQESKLDRDGIERREALIKLGKYAAYAPPMLIATVDAARAFGLDAPPPPVVVSGLK